MGRQASVKFAELQTELTELKAKMKKRAGIIFAEAASELFGEYPNLQAFSWAQYTDYFNDGETCNFYVRDYTLKMNLDGKWTGSEYEEEEEDAPPAPPELRQNLVELVNAIDSDLMKDMFGDHAEVTINRNGTADISDYEQHD